MLEIMEYRKYWMGTAPRSPNPEEWSERRRVQHNLRLLERKLQQNREPGAAQLSERIPA